MECAMASWRQKVAECSSVCYRKVTKAHLYFVLACVVSAFLLFSLDLPRERRLQTSPVSNTPPSRILDHPISHLVTAARREFSHTAAKQSRSFAEAVAEYQRRHGIDPPPHFDKWFEFVDEHDIPLVDEYDQITNDLRPFWGLSPAAIRRRISATLNGGDFLIGVFIRDGRIKHISGDPPEYAEWRQNAIKRALGPFTHLLPDMDLAFNMHDEPRVLIPHDQLVQMLTRASEARQSHVSRRSTWSSRPVDLNEGKIEPSSITPFLVYSHKFVWPVATLSCPPESPARISNFDGLPQPDDSTAVSTDDLHLVVNRTAFTDICLSPSLSQLHGLFNMPNALSATHDPVPILSPSKLSSFHDILFPAPWYLAQRGVYDEKQDIPWEEKKHVLYWRGTTTTGYSDGGIWRNQSRQRLIASLEQPGTSMIYARRQDRWKTETVDVNDYRELFDAHLTFIGQCSEADCEEQREYFDVRESDPYEENWQNKFLLDMDGNAFSGRFYSFLESRSLVVKQALFREWHESRIVPWVHYIPLGLDGRDHLEIMRFLVQDEVGQRLAKEMAEESRSWAKRSLRLVDMQAWMFRLLLEYARLVDDSRNELGFTLN